MSEDLPEVDEKPLRDAGRDPDRVGRQLDLLRRAPQLPVRRPATAGDGIVRLEAPQHRALEVIAERAASQGRVMGFVPASGAATRMFADLRAVWSEGGDLDLREPTEGGRERARRVLANAKDLAMWPLLEAHGAAPGDAKSILRAMFEGAGIDRLPKGLVPFHPDHDVPRTAFEEHLAEADRLMTDEAGTARAHFTVQAEHLPLFEATLDAARGRHAVRGVTLDVAFSVQDPATDTPALREDDRPARLPDGSLRFRPGGHGALLSNLASCGGDLVLVKNIDNVQPRDLRGPVLPWRRRLLGRLVELQDEAWEHVRALREGRGEVEAAAFASGVLGTSGLAGDALLSRLHRPWRVCGMVPASGHVGGGPYWVDGADGPTLQIVEGAQMVPGDPAAEGATHFNPVDMALGLRDADGEPFDLEAFTDPSAVIVTSKVVDGERLRVLELPGLWNGAMARWNTVFVELPALVFTPVKTAADLVKSEHGGPMC